MLVRKNIRVICPSSSFNKKDFKKIDEIKNKMQNKGFQVTFGENVFKSDNELKCASIDERVNDLHNAFLDKDVDIIMCGKGGFNVNQILPYIDFNIIKKNPKVICGFSDNTALLIAIYMKCNLVTYLGPNYINLEDNKTLKYFIDCIYNDNYLPGKMNFLSSNKNLEGVIVGGNLCTINLLQGTEYLKYKRNVIIFLEDDDNYKKGTFYREFIRNFDSLMQSNVFEVRGLVFGKFQKSCNITRRKLYKLIGQYEKLKNIPVVYDYEFGHNKTMRTIPIGEFRKKG